MFYRKRLESLILLLLIAAPGCGGGRGGAATGGTGGAISNDAEAEADAKDAGGVGSGGGAAVDGGVDTGGAGGTSGVGGGGMGGATGMGGAIGTGGATGTGGTGAGGATGTGGSTGAGGSGGSGTGGVAGVGGGGGSGGSGTGGVDPRCQVTWGGDVQVGTAEDDQILGMTIDADDNIFVAGYEQGVVGVTNIEPDGDSRAVVVKYSPAGTVTWKAVLDTAATETAEDVAIDPASGNLVVVGRTSGAFPTFVNQGQFDLFLAVLDPSGQITTVFQAGNERPQHPARLSLAPNGGVAVAGWDDTYIPTNYVAANQDGFIATFDIDAGPGYAISQTSLQYTFPPSATGPFSIATGAAAEQDGSGAVYLTSNTGNGGSFVTKLLADHSVAWSANISPLPEDAVNAVGLSPSGELFVTGGTFLTLGATSFGQEDAFVMKIEKDTGAPIWTAQAGGADSDYPTALAFDANGDIYISGYTLGSAGNGFANQGGVDIFAMKFSATGALLSVWQAGTAADDFPTATAVNHCGDVFVAGFTTGALIPGQPSVGGEDMFILRAALAPPGP